ncbi:MAG: precorrin-2 dehydrogenase/sirohydrochlorin ferrochelatase family protein, partial [Acidimicrobiia bacterium]
MSRLVEQAGVSLCLRVAGRPVVIVGGGVVAGRKIPPLLEAGAQVHVVAPLLGTKCQTLVDSGRIRWSSRPFEPADLDSAWLAVAATDDPEVNRLVVDTGESRRVWVISTTGESPATTMAMARRGALSVAVGTGGMSPAVAVWVRDQLETVLAPELGSLLEVAAAVRASLA